jgi:hypothetical protein
MVALLLLGLLIGLGIASYLGYTVDTRDPEYSLGRLLTSRESNAENDGAGNLPVNVGPRSSVDRAAAF